MKNKKDYLSFAEWLEEFCGISWAYYDNNYDGRQADELYNDYLDYIDSLPEVSSKDSGE